MSAEIDTNNAYRATGKIIPAAEMNHWQDARALLQSAHNRVEEERKLGFDEGYKAGYDNGSQDVTKLLLDTQKKVEEQLNGVDREVAALVVALVERVIGEKPQEEQVVAVARTALKKLKEHKKVRVQVAPAVLDYVRQNLTLALEQGNSHLQLSVEADQRLAPEDCVIATDSGYIRADVESQLSALRETIFESVDGDTGKDA